MKTSLSSGKAWPIGIAAYFALGLTFIVSFTVFAMRQKMDLVRDDYYDQEIRYQQQIDRLNRTQPVAAQIAVDYDPARQLLTIALPRPAGDAPPTGRISFYRPSDAGLDHDVDIQVDANGAQQIDARQLRSGLWKVRVQWKSGGQEYAFEKKIVAAKAPPNR